MLALENRLNIFGSFACFAVKGLDPFLVEIKF